MAFFHYTRSQLKSRINAGIQGKIGMLVSPNDTVDEAVRGLFSDVDLRSARRKQRLVPHLFNGSNDYACPSDLKAYSIIDIPAQAKRTDGSFQLVPTEQFATKPEKGDIAIDDFNGLRQLKIVSEVDSNMIVISELDSTTSGGGTWAVGGKAENLESDTGEFIKGGGSLKFTWASGAGSTGYIENSNIHSFDITDYLDGTSSIFLWVYIASDTIAQGINSVNIRIGSSSSIYHTASQNQNTFGEELSSGWNLIRFDITSDFTMNSSVDNTSIVYAYIDVTYDTAPTAGTVHRFDYLVLMKGAVHDVKYYSKFGWYDVNDDGSASYIEESNDDGNFLVADFDEYNLAIKRGRWLASQETDLPSDKIRELKDEYEKDLKEYKKKNPSESKIMSSTYYNY